MKPETLKIIIEKPMTESLVLIRILKRSAKFFISLLEKWERGEQV